MIQMTEYTGYVNTFHGTEDCFNFETSDDASEDAILCAFVKALKESKLIDIRYEKKDQRNPTYSIGNTIANR